MGHKTAENSFVVGQHKTAVDSSLVERVADKLVAERPAVDIELVEQVAELVGLVGTELVVVAKTIFKLHHLFFNYQLLVNWL